MLVTDANGCTDSACVTISVEIPCGELFVTNAFSPNADGENDEFCLQGNGDLENCLQNLTISIYDRWGEKVYESMEVNFCWDGTYRGKISRVLGTAVFVYYLEAILIDNTEILKQGNISLIR